MKNPISAQTVHLYVSCEPHKQVMLFPHTQLTDCIITDAECVYCMVRAESLHIIQVKFNLQWARQVYVGNKSIFSGQKLRNPYS